MIFWAVLPLALVLGRTFLGDESPTGAFGGLALDQLQYLSWVREASEDILISNAFRTEETDAVFLHPLFLISGLISKLGVSVPMAWLLWAPVALATMVYGVLAYMRRLLRRGSERSVGFVLAFFLVTPILPLLDFLNVSQKFTEVHLLRAIGYQLHSVGALWGYLPKAFAIGLMPVVFLAAERALHEPSRRRVLLAVASAGGLMVSWLHPWQGVTVCLVLGALLVWYRFDRRTLPLLAVIAATALPVLYYFVLSRVSPDWGNAASDLAPPHAAVEWVMLVVGLSPFLLLAVLGARRPQSLQDRVLILWPLACVLTLFLPSSGWYYAAAGASVPLAVLMVRGWRSVPLGRIRSDGARTALVVGLLAAIAIPGSIHLLDVFRAQVRLDWFQYYSEPGEVQALNFLRDHPEEGAVFATPLYGSVVPAHTGRRVWSGHFAWTPNFHDRESAAKWLMTGRMPPARRRALLAGSGAKFFLADCRFTAEHVRLAVGDAVTPLRRFGCAGVYRIAGATG